MDPTRPLLAGGFPTHRQRDLGCRWLRYALPWHEIERQPGPVRLGVVRRNASRLFEKLGINLMLDLAHFGTPTWLPDAFADPDFPAALERFARAFGERYAGRVRCVCPINEPLITSLFCGDIGLWPPYGRGLNNYMTTLSRVGQGFCRAVKVLRETMPGVEILVSDSLEVAVTYEDSGPETSPVPARNPPRRRDPAPAPPSHRHRPRAGPHRPPPPAAAVDAKGGVFRLRPVTGS